MPPASPKEHFSFFLPNTIKMFVLLYHQNPPSLSTMLKCAGRFFIIASVFRVGKMKHSPSFAYLYVQTNTYKP